MVNATTLVKPCGVGNYNCRRIGSEQTDMFVGDSERLVAESEQSSLVYIAPAESFTLRDVPYEASERKLLRQTLPYALEEDLVDDVDDLHFALGDAAASTVPLAVVKKQDITDWLQESQSEGVEFQQVVSELQLLPLVDNSWALLVEGDRWLIRYGAADGFAMEAEAVPLALQLLLDEQEVLPESLMIYCREQQQAAVLNQLPEMLRGIVHWQGEDYWQAFETGYKTTPRINILQGEFALSLPWKKWWLMWKIVLIAFMAILVVQFAATIFQQQLLASRNLDLRADIEAAYRTVVPRGAVIDPERQLKRKVDQLQNSDGVGFMAGFAKISRVLSALEGISIQSLNYSGRQGELRLTLIANTFEDVETARTNLEKQGLKAELTGSSAEGEKTRARLKVSYQ